MRFRFCGDLDCPDWVLAGINLLSRLSSLKLRSVCTGVAGSLLDTPLNMPQLEKATSDAKLTADELRASVSVLSFVLESAVKHQVGVPELQQELQQLGLPREHAASLGRVLDKHCSALAERQQQRMLRLPGLAGVGWDVQVVQDSAAAEAALPEVHLRLQTDEVEREKLCLTMDLITAEVIRRELLLARQRMEDVG